MALISLEHVSKVYPKGTRPALDDINLDIDRGDFVFLVGASGSGKTTLLSLLLREEEATDGEIRVAGNASATPVRTAGAALSPADRLYLPGLQAAQQQDGMGERRLRT